MFKAHRLMYHSTIGLRVRKKKKRRKDPAGVASECPIYALQAAFSPLPSVSPCSFRACLVPPGSEKVAHVWDLSGRGTARAEDAPGTPTQSHISPGILVYEEKYSLP